MNDVFTPDAFKLQTLIEAITKLPYKPGRIGELGLFQEAGITNVDVAIEESEGVLQLVEARPRGAGGQVVTDKPRKIRSFRVPHLVDRATIRADEVQGVRLFGTDNQAEVIQTRVNERLMTLRANIDYTIEHHRVSAIKGIFYDANGGTSSLFSVFEVTQQTKAMGLSKTNASEIRAKVMDVKKMVRAALGGTTWTGLHVLCGDAFWEALLEDKDVKATYLNQQAANELRGNPSDSFTAFGATWEWYEGTSEVNFGDDAYAIPTGVPGLFITRYAPADYSETVNTIGLPYYAKAEPLKFSRGWELEAQSNPLNICTRPSAIIKLTI